MKFLLSSITILLLAYYVHCEDNCQNATVKCFQCDTAHNVNCSDPVIPLPFFRQTLITCEGCCLKVIQPDGNITRTCSSRVKPTFPSMNLGCGEDSTGTNETCFCAEDYCNSVPPTTNVPSFFQLVVLFILTLVTARRVVF